MPVFAVQGVEIFMGESFKIGKEREKKSKCCFIEKKMQMSLLIESIEPTTKAKTEAKAQPETKTQETKG